MEHVVRALTRSSAGVEIADIAFDHSKSGGATGRACEHIVEVRQMAGGKVVDSDDFLTEREEVLQQVGANEPRDASEDPDFGRERQMLSKMLIGRGVH